MKIIAITAPESIKDEVETIHRLFESDLEILHLRKPGYGRPEFQGLLEQIDQRYHQRIMLHAHHHLMERYQLRGRHFPAVARDEKNENSSQPCSTSCHSIEELEQFGTDYEYAMVSPVFDSISKPGYGGGIDTKELEKCISRSGNRVVGLGGINDKTLKKLPRNCWGAAVLGDIWGHNSIRKRICSFEQLKTIAETL